MDLTPLEQALATLSPALDQPDQEEAVRTRWRLGARHPTTLPEELRNAADTLADDYDIHMWRHAELSAKARCLLTRLTFA